MDSEEHIQPEHPDIEFSKHETILELAQQLGNFGGWDLDVATGQLTWTNYTYEIFEIEPGSPVTLESFLQSIHPEDAAYVLESWEAALEGKPYDIEHRLLFGERVKWVREKASLWFNGEGKPYRALGFAQDITDKKLAEKERAESRQVLSSFFESPGLLRGIVEIEGDDLRHVLSNHMALEFFGAPDHENGWLARQTGFDDDTRRLWISNFYKARDTGQSVVFEYTHFKPGREYRFQTTVSYIGFESSNRERYAYIILDISEAYYYRQRLDESHQRFMAIFNEAVMGLALVWPDGHVDEANDQFTRNLSLDRARGQLLWPLLDRVTGDVRLYQLIDLIDSGVEKKVQFTSQINLEDGDTLWLSVTVTTFGEGSGSGKRYLVITDNITKRYNAEQALANSEQLLKQTEEVANVGSWQLDVIRDRVTWSEELFRIFGVTPVSAMNWDKVKSFFTKESLARLSPLVDRAVKSGESFEIEVEIINARGQRRVCLNRGFARTRNGRVIHVYGSFQDITERKEAELELVEAKNKAEEASVAKSNFISNVSHELRTPLHAIIGFTEILDRDETLAEEQSRYIHDIKTAGDHLLELINEVLDLSRIDSGTFTSHLVEINLQEFISGIATMFSSRAEEKGLEFRLEQSQLPAFVKFDALKLRQVAVNILSNAIKFTRSGSVSLHVQAESDSSNGRGVTRLVFRVVDTGPGIEPDIADSIFKPYVRSQNVEMVGTGLGLTISKRLLESMGGTIQIEKTSTDGTVFKFELEVEVVKSQLKTRSPLPAGQQQVDLSGLKTLIVDDDRLSLKLLEKIMSRWGAEVEQAENGLEALKKVESFKPDLIFMDMRMPEMTGYEAVPLIRQMNDGDKFIILALTANSFEDEIEKIRLIGCDTVVTKPYRQTTLAEALVKLGFGVKFQAHGG